MRRLTAMIVLVLSFASAALADGNHLILLIDDSMDMRGWKSELETKLPSWLFRGPLPADPSTPRFDPAETRRRVVSHLS